MNRIKHAALVLANKVEYVDDDQEATEAQAHYDAGHDIGRESGYRDGFSEGLSEGDHEANRGIHEAMQETNAQSFKNGVQAGRDQMAAELLNVMQRIEREITGASNDDGAE